MEKMQINQQFHLNIKLNSQVEWVELSILVYMSIQEAAEGMKLMG